jgi:putative hemolysin
MDSPAVGLLAVLALVAVNGFFVAAEFAIVAVRRSRLERLVSLGRPSAQAALHVVDHLDTAIAACQLGITMASLALGWIGEPAISSIVEPPLEAIVGPLAHDAAQVISAAASFIVITSLHIVIGELAPKGLALQRTENTVLLVARPLRLFETIFSWPIAVLNGVGNGLLHLFGLRPAAGHELVHSVEEVRVLVAGMQQAGVVEVAEARIASRAFAFGKLTAAELMTPRVAVEAASITISVRDVLQRAKLARHSRLLVFDQSLDDIVGVLHVRDLFVLIDEPRDRPLPRDLVRPVLITPASRHAHELLDELRASRRQLAVVIDEFGGTAGVVTIEDLVEALVGRIEDELPPAGEPPSQRILGQRESDGSVLLDGRTRLQEFEDLTGRPVDAQVKAEVDTLAGLIMALLGHLPAEDETIVLGDGRALRVERLEGRRVATVRLLPDAGDHHKSSP